MKAALIFKTQKAFVEYAKAYLTPDLVEAAAQGATIATIDPDTGELNVFMVESAGKTKKARQKATLQELSCFGEWKVNEILVHP
jgi:fructose-specific component phosphotransferase system IIB-like protein